MEKSPQYWNLADQADLVRQRQVTVETAQRISDDIDKAYARGNLTLHEYAKLSRNFL